MKTLLGKIAFTAFTAAVLAAGILAPVAALAGYRWGG